MRTSFILSINDGRHQYFLVPKCQYSKHDRRGRAEGEGARPWREARLARRQHEGETGSLRAELVQLDADVQGGLSAAAVSIKGS